jgi:hypothetical protein
VAACGAKARGGGRTSAVWDLRRVETARVVTGGSTEIYCGRLRCGIRGRRQDGVDVRWWGGATAGSGSDRGSRIYCQRDAVRVGGEGLVPMTSAANLAS